jgi:hypothetical protein
MIVYAGQAILQNTSSLALPATAGKLGMANGRRELLLRAIRR